jgi:hypothetical protein
MAGLMYMHSHLTYIKAAFKKTGVWPFNSDVDSETPIAGPSNLSKHNVINKAINGLSQTELAHLISTTLTISNIPKIPQSILDLQISHAACRSLKTVKEYYLEKFVNGGIYFIVINKPNILYSI